MEVPEGVAGIVAGPKASKSPVKWDSGQADAEEGTASGKLLVWNLSLKSLWRRSGVPLILAVWVGIVSSSRHLSLYSPFLFALLPGGLGQNPGCLWLLRLFCLDALPVGVSFKEGCTEGHGWGWRTSCLSRALKRATVASLKCPSPGTPAFWPISGGSQESPSRGCRIAVTRERPANGFNLLVHLSCLSGQG